MIKGLLVGIGIGLGAGLLYVLDPESGRRRRRRLRRSARRTYRGTSKAVDRAAENVRREAAHLRERFRENARLVRGDEPPDHTVRRLATGAAGTALLYYGIRKRGKLGVGLGTVGAAMAAYGITNRELRSSPAVVIAGRDMPAGAAAGAPRTGS